MKFFYFIALFLIISLKAFGLEEVSQKHFYYWKIIRVVDGDTLEIANEFLPKELKLFIRIRGIDTPEKSPKAKCIKENILAQKAFKFTKDFIETAQNNHKKIAFTNIKWDKFGGRILATVLVNGNDLSTQLLKNKLARSYNGEKKKSWCE
jgi:endonuclease YncB( thermonuclease family)